MLDASSGEGKKKKKKKKKKQKYKSPVRRVPLLALYLFILSIHWPPAFIPVCFIQQRGQQVRSLSTPGEKQIPQEECNKALSLCVSVCSVGERWAVLQSLPNKLVHTHKRKADSANQSLRDIQAPPTLGSSCARPMGRWS